MVGNTGTIYYRKTNAWEGMALLEVARGGWVNTVHGNLEFIDDAKARWIAKLQSMYSRPQAMGRTKTFGGIPGDVQPYGFGSLDSDGVLYAVVNPAQRVETLQMPLLSRACKSQMHTGAFSFVTPALCRYSRGFDHARAGAVSSRWFSESTRTRNMTWECRKTCTFRSRSRPSRRSSLQPGRRYY